jgi:RNA polymerase subunit RPABC4/transcription elongation factor Spt4
MKCNKCNAEISDSAKFCPECGSKINKVRHCAECGFELLPDAKFCPECGTKISIDQPSSALSSKSQSQQNEEKDDNHFFVITEEQLDELIGNEHKLLSINSIISENEQIADAFLDDDYLAIVGNKRGKTMVYTDFTYRSLRNRTPLNATIAFEVEVNFNQEVEVKDYNFINTDDEDDEDDDTWKKVNSFAKGAATFL